MQLVTVGSRYQIVIPKEVRKKLKGLRPGVKVGLRVSNENTATLNTEPKSWLVRTRGMMRKAWKGIDTTKYLEELRNEWDRKP